MNLGECKIGMLVGKLDGVTPNRFIVDVGFIKGLERNPCGEVIVKVEWSTGGVISIHPHNLIEIPSTTKNMYWHDGVMITEGSTDK